MRTKERLSPRLKEIVNALPLPNGVRVLEIGCGSGATARAIAQCIQVAHVLAIDRSKKAIQMAIKKSQDEITSGRLSFRQVCVEEFELRKNELPYDIAFAVRVGALDGRHPEIERAALQRIAQALTRTGKLFIDGGNPLKEISLKDFQHPNEGI
jgi:cyclopropane fatty-acyl-phospholipid synthase-like methyltransferase